MSPRLDPPSHLQGDPYLCTLPQGSRLTRVHDSRFGVVEFNPNVTDSDRKGGRFDSVPSDPYAFLYGAVDDRTAVSESLLRDLPSDDFGFRLLPRAQIVGKKISWMTTTRDLALVSLRSGRDLGAIGQDTWLVQSTAEDYHVTRKWASAIRSWVPSAAGLTWRSRLEPEGFAFVFFEDRCPAEALVELGDGLPLDSSERDLGTAAGAHYLNTLLMYYNVQVLL